MRALELGGSKSSLKACQRTRGGAEAFKRNQNQREEFVQDAELGEGSDRSVCLQELNDEGALEKGITERVVDE